MNQKERQDDIIHIIKNLDISPSMFKNAESKYTSIAEYLESHSLHADFYPQGSFALGTVVRPTHKDPNAGYDLDAICQVRSTREQLSAAELRSKVESILKSSNLYGGKLEISDRCITINYAEYSGYPFSIDIVPAADESLEVKNRLIRKSQQPDLIYTSIAIPEKKDNIYSWITNNPKGYRQWFEEINAPFLAATRDNQRWIIFEENYRAFASVDEIPDAVLRTPVQRVIQILKHHRNNYYKAFRDGEETKPISAIISTMVAHVAKTSRYDISVFELLRHVLTEVDTYREYQNLSEKEFTARNPGMELIRRQNGKWIVENPANPEDNLADRWNINRDIPLRFFNWIHSVSVDLINSLNLDDDKFRARIDTAFGPQTVSETWKKKYQSIQPMPISYTGAAKPWKKM